MDYSNQLKLLGQLSCLNSSWAKYPSLSSYHYANNNPLSFTGPTGESIKSVLKTILYTAVGLTVGAVTDGNFGWIYSERTDGDKNWLFFSSHKFDDSFVGDSPATEDFKQEEDMVDKGLMINEFISAAEYFEMEGKSIVDKYWGPNVYGTDYSGVGDYNWFGFDDNPYDYFCFDFVADFNQRVPEYYQYQLYAWDERIIPRAAMGRYYTSIHFAVRIGDYGGQLFFLNKLGSEYPITVSNDNELLSMFGWPFGQPIKWFFP